MRGVDMEGIALREPSCEKLDQGYSSQWELMGDLFAWLDRKSTRLNSSH